MMITMVRMKLQQLLLTTLALVLLLGASRVASAFVDGLLPNGNFELGPQPKDLSGTVVVNKKGLPMWELEGFVEYIKAGQTQADMLLVVPEGAFAVRLGNDASIKQKIQVDKGMYYSLTFSAARTCAQAEFINVSVLPEWGMLPMQTLYSSSGWDSYAWAFQAKYDVVQVVLHNNGKEEDEACGPLVDSIAMRALYPPPVTSKNLLKNADLEEGPLVLANTSWGVLIPPNIEDDHCPLPGWNVLSLKAVKYIDSDHYTVPQGQRAVELVAGKESVLSQTARTVPGRQYALSFYVGDAGDQCEGTMLLEAFAGRATLKVPYASNGKGGFKRYMLKFVATNTRTNIVFFSTYYHTSTVDYSTLCGPTIDDVLLLSVRNNTRLLL